MTQQSLTTRTVCIAAIAAFLLLPGGRAEAADDWERTLVPFFWLADMGVDVTIDGDPALGLDIKATDLIDKVEFAFSTRFEGRRGRGGFLVEMTYLSLADSLTLPDDVSIDADFTQVLLEGGGFYRLKNENSGLDVLFGFRVFEIDQVMDISSGDELMTVDSTTTLTDGFIGLRYGGPIGKKWSYQLRGDIGTGDTELSLNGIVGFGYEFGKTGKYSLVFAWRHLQFEIEENDGSTKVASDMSLSGPGVGLKIKF